jgi:hypothetical protein
MVKNKKLGGQVRPQASGGGRGQGRRHTHFTWRLVVRTLHDAKTLAWGDAYTSFSAAQPNGRETFPVEKRAAKVPKQYLAAARDLDQKFHNSKRGEVGPIEAKLLEFGARDGPKPRAAVGFVLGAFSEISNSCYSLFTAIERVGAARVATFCKITPKRALALCNQRPCASGVLRRNAAGLASSWAAFTIWYSPPRRSHGRHARARLFLA